MARTLAQAVSGLACVPVPSAHAVAQNAAALEWKHLGVILDAKEELIYAQMFERAVAPPSLSAPAWAPWGWERGKTPPSRLGGATTFTLAV